MKILRWMTRPWRWLCARMVEVGRKQLRAERIEGMGFDSDAYDAKRDEFEALRLNGHLVVRGYVRPEDAFHEWLNSQGGRA